MGFNGFMETGQLQLYSIDSLERASLHFLDKSRHHLGDKTIQILVKEGDFAESILLAAKELHIDVIVMGSHSRKWLENIVMGSVTEKVLHHSSIPLFIIPTKKHN
jgi:nucleotide-binding universal stress UspA family protein